MLESALVASVELLPVFSLLPSMLPEVLSEALAVEVSAFVLPDVADPASVLPLAPAVDDFEVPAFLALPELPPALLLLLASEVLEDAFAPEFPDLLVLFDDDVVSEPLFWSLPNVALEKSN